jgi:hypothetical protein
MKSLLKPLTLLIIATSLSSCVGIRSDKYSAIKSEELKVASVKKSKIFIDWGFHTTLIDNPQQNIIDKAKSDQKKIFAEVIKESDCCEMVNEKDEADIVIEGAFYNESSKAGIYAAFVSGLTFTAIPCWTNSKMRIVAKVNKSKMVKNYDIKDSVFTAIWAPLIVATPFANAITAEAEVNKNLYKNLVVQMKKDGFFVK